MLLTYRENQRRVERFCRAVQVSQLVMGFLVKINLRNQVWLVTSALLFQRARRHVATKCGCKKSTKQENTTMINK
jgi:hypothetical protein